MEPCFTSWTGFRVVSIQCVRSYEETQHNQCDHPHLSCCRHRLGASGPPLCLHAQSCCRSDLVDNADAHARCEVPLRNPSSRQHGSPSEQVRLSWWLSICLDEELCRGIGGYRRIFRVCHTDRMDGLSGRHYAGSGSRDATLC